MITYATFFRAYQFHDENIQDLLDQLQKVRKDKKLVFTNGCFDLLHPGHVDYLNEYKNDESKTGEFIVFDGSVRELAPLAPNNVNTMACAALAGSNLGFFL